METRTCWAQVKDDFCPNIAQPKSEYCAEHEWLEDNEYQQVRGELTNTRRDN